MNALQNWRTEVENSAGAIAHHVREPQQCRGDRHGFQSREALQAAVDSRQHRNNAVDL
jgi:hypothetical protein